MKPLTVFGLFAVSAMLVCYALENRSAWYILGFAVSCALGSIYGFLQGAWPFGLVEAIWSGVALRKWWLKQGKPLTILVKEMDQVQEKSHFNFFGALFFAAFWMLAAVFTIHLFKH